MYNKIYLWCALRTLIMINYNLIVIILYACVCVCVFCVCICGKTYSLFVIDFMADILIFVSLPSGVYSLWWMSSTSWYSLLLLLFLLSSVTCLMTSRSTLTAFIVRDCLLFIIIIIIRCVLLILASCTWASLLLTCYIAILNEFIRQLNEWSMNEWGGKERKEKLISFIQIYWSP